MESGELQGLQGRISPAEFALLEYAKKLTIEPWHVDAENAQQLREHGWAEPQIAEAVYIIALFAFFNRVADAFGIR